MDPTSSRPPVLVAGGHRCGTTLVATILSDLGLWTGAVREANEESLYFLRRNEWILRRAGGAWDRPLPARDFLADPRFLDDVVAFLRRDLGTRRFAEYTGRSGLLRGPRREVLNRPWGWKDPRNVFTGPVWLQLFPEARLVLVERHGVDAAQSLLVRERSRWEDPAGPAYLDLPPWPAERRRSPAGWEPLHPYLLSMRCRSLEESFALWEEYAAEGEALFREHPGPKLRVRFEALLADPAAEIRRLADFAELGPSAESLETVVRGVRRDRALAFARDPELLRFHEEVRGSPALRARGYADPPAGN